MKNLRVKVIESCTVRYYWFSICEGRKQLMMNTCLNRGSSVWERKPAAIRNAKAMANRIGILYDTEIIKEHGC